MGISDLPMSIGDLPRSVADLMDPAPRTVHPSTSVEDTVGVIREQRHAGLPVVEADRLVGFVTPMQLLQQPPDRPIGEIMLKDLPAVHSDLALPRAYEILKRHRADVLPVADAHRLVGVITLAAVLEVRSQDRDPLTGLPWAGALRAWAMGALERGKEVAALFIDLDNFGVVNKALGHVVGDGILRSVSSLLAGLIDPSTDCLCRYGGDEFAVATTRRGDEASLLAHRIRETVNVPVEIEGITERVTASVGFAGGRRIERRTSSHIASTMDDLLTLASRGSTLAKESGRGVTVHGSREVGRSAHWRTDEIRLRLVRVATEQEAFGSAAIVELALGDRVFRGRTAGRVRGRGVPFLVCDATLQAIAQAAGADGAYLLEDLSLVPGAGETLAIVTLVHGAGRGRYTGSARAPEPHVAVSRATLAALNRRLSRTLVEAAGRAGLGASNRRGKSP